MQIQIRKYQPADKLALTNCLTLLQDHIAAMDPLKHLRRAENFDATAYVKETLKIVKQNRGIIFLAEAQDEKTKPAQPKIIGCIVAMILKNGSTNKIEAHPSKQAQVLELFVMPKYRGHNIGKLLIKKVEDHYKELGYTEIIICCFSPNKNAYKFYNHLGYKDRFVNLIKKI